MGDFSPIISGLLQKHYALHFSLQNDTVICNFIPHTKILHVESI